MADTEHRVAHGAIGVKTVHGRGGVMKAIGGYTVLLYDPAKEVEIEASLGVAYGGGRARAKDRAAKKAGFDKPAAILAKYPRPSREVFVRDVAAIIPEADGPDEAMNLTQLRQKYDEPRMHRTFEAHLGIGHDCSSQSSRQALRQLAGALTKQNPAIEVTYLIGSSGHVDYKEARLCSRLPSPRGDVSCRLRFRKKPTSESSESK